MSNINNDSQKEKFDRLIYLLSKVGNVLMEYKDRMYIGCVFNFYGELGEFILQTVDKLKTNDLSNLKELWLIYIPTGDFDDAIGDLEIGCETFELLNSLYKVEISRFLGTNDI